MTVEKFIREAKSSYSKTFEFFKALDEGTANLEAGSEAKQSELEEIFSGMSQHEQAQAVGKFVKNYGVEFYCIAIMRGKYEAAREVSSYFTVEQKQEVEQILGKDLHLENDNEQLEEQLFKLQAVYKNIKGISDSSIFAIFKATKVEEFPKQHQKRAQIVFDDEFKVTSADDEIARLERGTNTLCRFMLNFTPVAFASGMLKTGESWMLDLKSPQVPKMLVALKLFAVEEWAKGNKSLMTAICLDAVKEYIAHVEAKTPEYPVVCDVELMKEKVFVTDSKETKINSGYLERYAEEVRQRNGMTAVAESAAAAGRS